MSSDSIPASTTKTQEEAPTNSLPIAQTATENGQPNQHGEPEERLNKYVYPEFAGYKGEEYLDTVLHQILPAALHRTWWYAVKHQAPGKECYVGTARIASKVKPGIRKIELDFQELEARGLMRKYPARLPVEQEDGTMRLCAVTIKDFRPLYDLAHEYHLWLRSDEFIPPSRDYREIILSNLKLLAKLVRFDNYRRVIECAKPGRKPQPKPQHYYYHYHCSQPTEQEEAPDRVTGTRGALNDEGRCSTDLRTDGQNANLYSNSFDKIVAPYRESDNQEFLFPSDSDSNRSEEIVADAAIRNSIENETEPAPETGTEWPNDGVSKSKTPNPSQERNAPARAKQVEEEETLSIEELRQDPFALATALAEMVISERQDLKAVKQPRLPSQRARRGTPEPLAREMAYYAQELGSNPNNLQSDITRVTKIYWTATQIRPEFTNKWFQEQLKASFEKAHRRRVKNRPAYFFACLENRLHFAPDERAYLLSEEPLYQDGLLRNFTRDLRRHYARSGSTLDYHTWVRQEILLEQPKL